MYNKYWLRLKKVLIKNIIIRMLLEPVICLKRLFFHGSHAGLRYHMEHRLKVAFLVISKTANTSMQESLFNIHGGDGSNPIPIQVQAKLIPIYQLRPHLPFIKNLMDTKYNNYFKFAFVRNPFDRLVSCYKDKYHAIKKWKSLSGENRLPPYYCSYLFGYLKKDKGFKEFARKISKIPPVLAEQHFVPQAFLLFDKEGNKRVDFVGRFENLESDWAMLMERYNLSPLSHYNSSGKGNWMDYYDRETAELVYKYYKKDVEAFGYEDSYRELMEHIEKKEEMQKVLTSNL